MKPLHASAGSLLSPGSQPSLFLLEKGEVTLLQKDNPWEKLTVGSFWGEEEILYGVNIFKACAESDVQVFVIPGGLISDIPIVQWRLLQTNEKRMRSN
jgi:hemerythrin